MSYFDDASLVMIPSGYKTSKVYSVKPTDGTGDLAFTRSNDTATRVGPDGLIEKVRTNLILQSEAFNVTWVPVRSSVTANTTTAPDGTSTADTLFDNTDANLHYVSQSFTAITGPATISVYAKANQLSQIQIVAQGGTAAMGRGFDLSTGTTFAESVGGVTSNDLGQNITAVGDGWYRCTMSWTSTGQTSFWILTSKTNASTYVGTGTDGVFIWGAQLETGDIATDYIATTTAAVSVGPVANVPRLDYLNSSCPRLLLEPQRVQLLQFSEQMDNAVWTKTGGTISANVSATVDPSGYNGADKLVGTAGAADQVLVGQSISLGAAGTYTFSFFVKAAEKTWVRLRTLGFDAGGNQQTWFNLSTGAVGTDGFGNSKIVSYGNGWYRCIVSFATTTDLIGSVYAYLADSDNTTNVTRNGTDGLYLWGSMLELGSYATSYVNSLGAAVTRGADAASKTGISSLIGQTEGTIFVDITTTDDITTVTPIGISDGTGSNRVILYVGSGILNALVTVSGVAQATISSSSISANTRYKMAIGYKENDFAFYVNGVQIGTDTSGTVPACSKFNYDNGSGSAPFYGLNNQALLFPTRLSNSELAALTA